MKDERLFALLSNLHLSSFIQNNTELFFPFCPLLAVFGFLTRTATAMGTGDVSFFLGFCPHLAFAVILALVAATASAPNDAALNDGINIHSIAHSRKNQ